MVCPRCDAGAVVPCAKMGRLVAFVEGMAFHMERWESAIEALSTT